MDAATKPKPIIFWPAPAYRSFCSAATDTISFRPQLDELLTVENAHGYAIQASTRAHSNTLTYLEPASASLGRLFPKPEFIPDGEGGIDTEWENGRRNLTLSCRGRDNQADFIYWEENGDYDGAEASLELLLDKLEWLKG